MPLGTLSAVTVAAALPLIFGGLSGVLCERSGVVNVAIEGQLLTGAFLAASSARSPATGSLALIGAAIGGALISALLAVLSIRYLVDQVVVGIVLNAFALGLTGYFYEQLMQRTPERYNEPPASCRSGTSRASSDIPVIGPALFRGTILTLQPLSSW